MQQAGEENRCLHECKAILECPSSVFLLTIVEHRLIINAMKELDAAALRP